jgi:hypothetical protein
VYLYTFVFSAMGYGSVVFVLLLIKTSGSTNAEIVKSCRKVFTIGKVVCAVCCMAVWLCVGPVVCTTGMSPLGVTPVPSPCVLVRVIHAAPPPPHVRCGAVLSFMLYSKPVEQLHIVGGIVFIASVLISMKLKTDKKKKGPSGPVGKEGGYAIGVHRCWRAAACKWRRCVCGVCGACANSSPPAWW